MKLSLACLLSLILAVVVASAIGYAPTQARWGEPGVQSMLAIAVICLVASGVAAAPMFVVAPRWPAQIGNAVLAGTVIRLLATMAGMVGYQILAQPHSASFLFWATIYYLTLLAVDVAFGVVSIQKHYRATPNRSTGAAS